LAVHPSEEEEDAVIPSEWLRELVEARDGYRRLVEESGTLAEAAYRLAVAKCMSRERATRVPTQTEVRAAAKVIARHVGGAPVPSAAALAADLEAAGLSIL
jgi:hypothetical protein